jgi:hypothetical protein
MQRICRHERRGSRVNSEVGYGYRAVADAQRSSPPVGLDHQRKPTEWQLHRQKARAREQIALLNGFIAVPNQLLVGYRVAQRVQLTPRSTCGTVISPEWALKE